jgi:hypothetical protein
MTMNKPTYALYVKKEGKIYHIQGSGMTRSLKRDKLAH